MKNQQINWEDARYLLSIARIGQLGKAAESLGVSVMTLSRHLNQLQTRLGSVLLTRHSKGMQLTNEGSRLVEYLERAEAEIEAAGSIFDQTGRSVSGTVRIAAPEGFALKVLTPRLVALAAQHPDLKLEIVSQTPGFSLSRREADVAVMVGKPSEPQLNFESLGTYRLGLYVSRDYASQHSLPEHFDELSSHRLVGYVEDLLFSERLNVARTVWSGWQSNIAISSPVAQVEAVKAGLGIGVLHDFLLDNTDGLLPVFPDLDLSREFFLVSHPTMDRIPRIHTVLKFMRSLRNAVH
jgi:DNA-binding transcriptional LysR family regulator